jgi:hypothetical protein
MHGGGWDFMSADPTNQPASAPSRSAAYGVPPTWWRPIALATAFVFCVSAVFPTVAAFVQETEAWPKWWGVADVAIAFVLVVLAFAISGSAQGKVTKDADALAYRAYRVLLHGILVILVVFFLAGDRIVWINCITGFAWRAWLLLYALPGWLTMFGIGTAR